MFFSTEFFESGAGYRMVPAAGGALQMSRDVNCFKAEKPRRPRSRAALGALLMAVMTTLVAWQAVHSVREAAQEPAIPIQIIVEGSHDYGISQQSVDRLLDSEPIYGNAPLRVQFTDRHLTADEKLNGDVPANTVLISTQMDDLESQDGKGFAGTGYDRALAGSQADYRDRQFELDQSFRRNVAVGHGASAVLAAAQTATSVLHPDPTAAPIWWIGAVGLCAMLTAAFLAAALRYRSRWDARYRRLAAAQRQLARVVLDLEALEATYQAAGNVRRPQGFQATWEELQALSLEAARREEPLATALFSRRTALDAQTNELLSGFEADARELTGLADALLEAGSVHAQLPGTSTAFDTLNQPIYESATKLLRELGNLPERVVPRRLAEELRTDLGELLDAARAAAGETLPRWSAAERQLADRAGQLAGRLRRMAPGQSPRVPEEPEEHLRLLHSLGLQLAWPDTALHALSQAGALAAAMVENTPSGSRHSSGSSLWRRVLAVLAGTPAQHVRPRLRWWRRALLAVLLCALLAASLLASGAVVARVTHSLDTSGQGAGEGMALEFDDPAGQISEAEVRRYMDEDFEVEQQLTVAVRDAEDYLDFVSGPRGDRDATPQSVRSALWRIKDEFPQLQQAGELLPNKAIVPLLLTDTGEAVVPGLLTGEVLIDPTWAAWGGWNYGSIFEASNPALEVASSARDYAQTLAKAREVKPDYPVGALFLILVLLFFFSVLNAVQAVRYLLGASLRMGRLGRGAKSLAAARQQLEQLLLGLEEAQLNAVAVLGAQRSGRADQAGQRLFERALLMAWREAAELDALPLSERLQPSYARRAAQLTNLVGRLGEHDADVARRASVLIRASRGAAAAS